MVYYLDFINFSPGGSGNPSRRHNDRIIIRQRRHFLGAQFSRVDNAARSVKFNDGYFGPFTVSNRANFYPLKKKNGRVRPLSELTTRARFSAESAGLLELVIAVQGTVF